MDKSKVVIIKSFPTAGEALIYKSLLESGGVECELINETVSDVLPLQNELMNVKLAVAEKDAEKAREILSGQIRPAGVRHREHEKAQKTLITIGLMPVYFRVQETLPGPGPEKARMREVSVRARRSEHT